MPRLQELGGARARASPRERDTPELRLLRVRIEDKGPIAAFHWRGVPDEEAALDPPRGTRAGGGGRRARDPLGPQGAGGPAAGADRQGPGRARPGEPAPACAPRSTAATTPPTSTPSTRSTRCRPEGALEARVRVGRPLRRGAGRDRRARRPGRSTASTDSRGAGGARGRLMRFRDFLRTAVLLFGGAATALAAVSVVGRRPRRRQHARLRGARLVARWPPHRGLWMGRGAAHHGGHRAACSPARAEPPRCPSSSPARSSSTGSGRSRCWPWPPGRSASSSRRCRRWRWATPCSWRCCGASSPRRWRRSRGATAWSSGSTAARRSAPPRLLRAAGPAQDRAGGGAAPVLRAWPHR